MAVCSGQASRACCSFHSGPQEESSINTNMVFTQRGRQAEAERQIWGPQLHGLGSALRQISQGPSAVGSYRIWNLLFGLREEEEEGMDIIDIGVPCSVNFLSRCPGWRRNQQAEAPGNQRGGLMRRSELTHDGLQSSCKSLPGEAAKPASQLEAKEQDSTQYKGYGPSFLHGAEGGTFLLT